MADTEVRAAGYTALLWISVALLPKPGIAASLPQIQALVAQAEREAFSNPEALNRDAHAALDDLKLTADAALEIRTRLLLCEYDSERDLAAAAVQARQALALLPQAHDPGLRAGVLTCQGESRETAGDNAQALQLFGTAIDVATAAHNDEKLAAALYSRGYLLGLQGEYAAGLVDLRRAQQLYDGVGRRYDAVSCLDSIATLYSRMGDNAEAAHLYAEVLRLQRQSGMVREQAVTLHNLARTYERSQQWRRAQSAFSQALELAQGLKYPRAEAYALRGLAAVKIAAHDSAGALADLVRAGALQSETPDARLAAQINLDKGRALHLAGRLTESLAALQQARDVFKSADSAAELVGTDDELAVVEAALGEWRAAYLIRSEAAQQQELLLSHQLDQRFAALKVEYDTAAQQQENRALLRENAATSGALDQSRRVRQLQGVVIGLGLALGAVLIWLVLLHRGRAQRLGSLALTDELTQAPNRRAVLALLNELLQRPEANPCAILIMDIDFFKRINDQHGHAAGDEVLKLVSEAVRSVATSPAFFGRLGGEEFLIVVPDADLAVARRWGEALRQKIAAIDIRAVIRGHGGVTTSVGLTVSIAGADDPGSMLARADLALYAAKRSGRNCVRVEPAPEDGLLEDVPGPGMLEETVVLQAPVERSQSH
ncbi:MAG TPA: tetratricopeptide repeat-containing diguanylate cyclase [Steroidobacteraceae bacterium]|nr:tetratricopeptide repeat-containing diguanylate cyclase [Steroidobacteraceae bacterium]